MRTLLILWVMGLSAVTVWAQEVELNNVDELPVSSTPRQKIVNDVSTNTTNDVVLDLRGTAELESEPETEIGSESVETPELEIEFSEEISSTEPKSPPALAPFYTSAVDYLGLRGGEKHDQLILDYEIETGQLGTDENRLSENVRLILGPDYASLTGPNSQKIYDFKMNRFLEIKPVKTLESDTESALFLDNVSIFSKAYRNISTVRQATQNGQKRRIKIAKDIEVDSFWLESSMSWAATKLDGPLNIKSTDSGILAIWDDLSVVSASFDEANYEKTAFKNSLFAFAHHVWPIHPQILIDFYTFDSPPIALEMVSFGPNQPKGLQQKWTLTSAEMANAEFPLPLNALSPVERKPMTPLVFVISEAVKNTAMGGAQSESDLATDFEDAQNTGDKIAQWLAGQKYIAYTGRCQKPEESQLCADLNDLSESNKFAAIGALDPKTKSLSDFINATELAKLKKDRATALLALQPYLDDADTPGFILRIAAMARASMKKSAAKKAGVEEIQAEALLKQSLAKDPYDPHTYVGLAQVFAANGAFEQSWDIYDVLRAAIPTVEAVPLKIDQAEANLLSIGPGYFIPN